MFKKTIDGITKLLVGIHNKLRGENKPADEVLEDRATKVAELQERHAKALEELSDKEMTTSLDGLIEIASHEGICQTKYKDSVGVWTIGIGATRSEIQNLAKWPMDKKLSVKECFDLFKKSIKRYERAVRRGLKVDVPQHVFDALVSWCYNVGTGWVKKATVIKLLNKGVDPSDRSVYQALMMYKKPKEIIGRRRKEADLLCYGKYSSNGKAMLFPVSKSGKPLYSNGKVVNVRKYL